MTFQDSGANVSKKIYSKCGKPTFNRSKRKADYKNSSEDNPNMEIRTEPMKIPGKKKHKKVEQIERSFLEKIIIDIKQVRVHLFISTRIFLRIFTSLKKLCIPFYV